MSELGRNVPRSETMMYFRMHAGLVACCQAGRQVVGSWQRGLVKTWVLHKEADNLRHGETKITPRAVATQGETTRDWQAI